MQRNARAWATINIPLQLNSTGKQLPEGPYRAQASNSQQSDCWSSRLDYQDECMEDVGFHEAMPHKGRENSRELCVISPLLGEVGMRASVSSNLIFGVGESASL